MREHDSPWKVAACLLRGVMVVVALLSFALPAVAQEKVWRVGLLTAGSEELEISTRSTWRAGLLQSLDRSGYRIGKNLELVGRYAERDVNRLPDLAQEIATAKVDVVVAVGDASVRAMLAATEATPIVMVVGADPVAVGFVASMARPGGRVTGLAFQTHEGDVKRLQFLREAMPDARRFGYLRPPGPIPARAKELLVEAARNLGVELTIRAVSGLEPAAYEAAFASMRDEGAAGVLIASTLVLANDLRRFGPIAQALRLPIICEWDYMATNGCFWPMVTISTMLMAAPANTLPAFSRALSRPICRSSSPMPGSLLSICARQRASD
jgi:putative ABC transport system substrate-binding protein